MFLHARPSQDVAVVSRLLPGLQGSFGAYWEAIAAVVIIVVPPTLVLFLLQRFVSNGITSGATKRIHATTTRRSTPR